MSQRRSVVGAKIKGKGKMSLTEDEPVFLGDFGIDKGKGKMSLTEVEPVFLGDFGIDKGKWDRGKVDGTDVRVTRSQTKNKVLELKGLRSRTSHNRLVKARGRERVTTADDESEDDIECDSSDNSESCEDDAENDSDYDSYDNSEFGEGETEKDDHEVVEDASKGEGKMIVTEEEPVFLGNMGNDKGKGGDLDRGKVDGTDMRVTRSQTRKKVLEVKGLRSRTTHKRLVKGSGMERVTSSDDETEDDTEWDSFNNGEFSEDDTENDTEDASSDNCEFGEGESEKDNDNLGEDDHEVVEDNHEVVEDGCEDELDYVDSVQGCVFCTVCNPPTEVTRQRVQVNTPEANDMTTTEYYNQD